MVKWSWKKGEATTTASIGNPLETGRYLVCLYPDGGLVGETSLPAGASWSFDPKKGYRYSDSTEAVGGVGSLAVRPDEAGRASVKLKAKGVAIPEGLVPSGITSFAAQLVDTQNDTCWGSSFPTGVVKPGQFKAKAFE